MTNDEANEILREEAYLLYGDDSPYNRQAFDLAITALERGKWISVEEKLPENDSNCIVFSSGDVKEAHFFFGRFFDPIEDYMQYNATHWMPLPEPPKEET